MSKMDSIQNLRQASGSLKSMLTELDAELSELKRCIEAEEFIPGMLGEKVTEKLAQIGAAQKDLEAQFALLEIGTFPAQFGELSERLDKYQQYVEETGRYLEAVQFFMTLQADDEVTQSLLDERKKYLSSLKLDARNAEFLKTKAECYVWLQDAFYESDARKKFSLMYRLAGSFEEAIAMGIQFGTIESREEAAGPEVSSNHHDVGKSNHKDIEKEQDGRQDIIEEPAEGKNDVSEGTEAAQTSDGMEGIWEKIGITDPASVICEEDGERLRIESAPRSADKFGVKEFKKDMMKQVEVEKIACLTEAVDGCGFTKDSIALLKNQDESNYILAADKLFQLGYLRKYIVKGLSEFYTLSPRGRKAFMARDSLAFIYSHFPKKKSVNLRMEGEPIEDSTNSAIARILCYSCYARMLRINNTYSVAKRIYYLETDFFYLQFPNALGEKSVAYFGIVSEEPGQFKEAYDSLRKIRDDVAYFIVLAVTREKALSIAEWLLGIMGDERAIWYCGAYDRDLYDAKSGDIVDIDAITHLEEEGEAEADAKADQADAKADQADAGGNADRQKKTLKASRKAAAKMAAEKIAAAKMAGFNKAVLKGVDGKGLKEAVSGENVSKESVSGGNALKAADLKETVLKGTNSGDTGLKAAVSGGTESNVPEPDIKAESIESANGSRVPTAAGMVFEPNKAKYTEEYQKMLASNRFYGATAYVKALSKDIPYYASVYRQLAYALNDPMGGCSYSSDAMINVYYHKENPVSDYFVVSAVIRNYFYDQFSYDYSLPQLQAMVSGNRVLCEEPIIDKIVYVLQQFKADNHKGMDRYADYREKERALWEVRIEETRLEAKDYYENYSARKLKENASHKRVIETGKLLFGTGSKLSEYLQAVIDDKREKIDRLEEFLAQYYVKDQAVVCEENIDPAKIDAVLDVYWNLAAQNMRLVKKSSDLVSSLRMNLYKRVHKMAAVLCNYVFLVRAAVPTDSDPVFREYRKIRNNLLKDIDEAIARLKRNKKTDLPTLAGKSVLMETLHEIKDRMEGTYKEGNYKYFYVNFLKNDKVLLDDDFLPVLDDVPELPEFTIRARIVKHCQEAEKSWEDRLKEIFNGGDDYGSAGLIYKYLKVQKIKLENLDVEGLDDRMPWDEKVTAFPRKDMENKRAGFIEDLELAQSYGQIDNTIENSKETIIQIMETWFAWANETKNYGFFAKILDAFKEKIHKDAEARAIELNGSLAVYLEKNPNWREDELAAGAVGQIKDRIEQQNYAAAEDLLNRLITNDLDFEVDLPQVDYLVEFLNEYDVNYRKIAKPGATLKSLVYSSKMNKDTKGANRLLESWPRGACVGENTLRMLLGALGFKPDGIKTEAPLQEKIESYLVTLKRPQNGRKSNYKHPISAFGSEAEEKGFRVACIFGKTDASRLIDTFREIGNAKNTIVLLDYALTLADRRTLARKTKTDLTGKIFAVIDRVVLVYLANHYMETAINRMLMAVIMPFASYQPYIDKSADVMPQEIFIGRKNELEKIESPTGVNIVYGGRQLGKTALLRMAKKDIDMDENGDRAVIVNAWRKDYRATAKEISVALFDEGILKKENITEDWGELARDIKNRLRDQADPIPYFLLMIDEADVFIESCEAVGYQPFDALKEIQGIGTGRFKFVVAGLRNIVRFKRTVALGNNSVLTHLDSLTVKPFKTMEARELLEVPLSYLGFRFPRNNETEVLVSTIFGTANYFPGLIQLYCTKLIEAVKRDYAGYSESETPPYYVQKEHIKKVLAEQSLQQDIREKFFITLKVGEDDYYYIIALLVAYHYHEGKSQGGCSAQDLLAFANSFSVGKLTALDTEKIAALMEEMRELNVLQNTGDGRYRFTRHSFCQMMGTTQQIEDELLNYMEG